MEESRKEQVEFAKHFERAQGWLALDKYDEAARSLEKVPARFQARPEVLLVRGQLHMDARQWVLAEPVLRQLLKLDDTEPQYWVNLAFVVRRAKSIAEAEPILLEARRRFPAVALIWYNLACYAAQSDRLREAHDLLREAIRLEPGLEENAKEDPDLGPYWQGLVLGGDGGGA